MVSCSRLVDKSMSYTLVDHNNIKLPLKEEIKLRIEVCSLMKSCHFQSIFRTIVYMMLCIIKRNFRYPTFILIFKTIVRFQFHLDYCYSIQVPYKKGDIEILEKCRKGQLKFCYPKIHILYVYHISSHLSKMQMQCHQFTCFQMVKMCRMSYCLCKHILCIYDPGKPLLPPDRHHRSNGDCLEGKRENYQVCSVQYCVQQLCTVQCTYI